MVNEIADLLIRCGAIEFGDFVLSSGAKSSYYIDVKTASTNPEFLQKIGEEISARFDFEVVAGVAVGAVPIAVATSLASGRPFAIIRKGEKEYGKGGSIIGAVQGKDVLLVEDVSTSGKSTLYGIQELRDAGAHADQVVTVVDREQGAEKTLLEADVHLYRLARVSELIKR